MTRKLTASQAGSNPVISHGEPTKKHRCREDSHSKNMLSVNYLYLAAESLPQENSPIMHANGTGVSPRRSPFRIQTCALKMGEEKVRHVEISPDGERLDVRGSTGLIAIYDLPSQELEMTLAACPDSPGELVFSPDSSLLFTASQYEAASVWDLEEQARGAHR